MAAKVATSDSGMVSAGITVALTLRRNTKTTATTRTMDSSRLNCTSSMEASMVWVRSPTRFTFTSRGSCAISAGRRSLIAWVTASTL